MVRLRGGLMLGIVVLSVVCAPVLGREMKLTICPQKVSAEAGKYRLLPPSAGLTNGDAVPLYEKAVKALPDKASDKQIREWLAMPLEELPTDQVEKVLGQYIESFKGAAQAVKCRDCNWPAWTPGTQVANLDEYRRLGFALRLWARFELASGQYEGALLAMQTGFGMAGQIGQAPTLIQLQMGIAMTASMSREIEQLAQIPDAPNLYAALAALPRPFADVEKVIESEKKAAASSRPGVIGRLVNQQMQSVAEPAYEATRTLVKRLDRDLTALQCIEAIRAYTASHGGQLPQALTEITEVSVPKDPVNDAAFRYTRTGSAAILESPAPAGKEKREELRYELTVKK